MMLEKVKEMVLRHQEIEQQMASPEIAGDPSQLEKLGREYNAIGRNLPSFRAYLQTFEQLRQARDLLSAETDEDVLTLAREEIASCEASLPELEEKIKYLLVPKDPIDFKNAIMEIRAGTGGIEAGIFAGDLYRMYTHYVEARGWTHEVLSSSFGDLSSIKEIVFMVSGEGAYGSLKYESGVHRVQRVPQTEAQGRIHTSAASVVVMPEVNDVEITIDPADLRIDTYRASGAGGQHVNKTESAIRIIHIPTGLMVTCQDEKSQHKNKARALKVLQSRLYEMQQQKREAEDSATRKSIIRSGDRSDKIRTYNFPQNRITDHRINFSLHKLDAVIDGDLQDLLDALAKADTEEKMR
jgi:peptide chain release factor 1